MFNMYNLLALKMIYLLLYIYFSLMQRLWNNRQLPSVDGRLYNIFYLIIQARIKTTPKRQTRLRPAKAKVKVQKTHVNITPKRGWKSLIHVVCHEFEDLLG